MSELKQKNRSGFFQNIVLGGLQSHPDPFCRVGRDDRLYEVWGRAIYAPPGGSRACLRFVFYAAEIDGPDAWGGCCVLDAPGRRHEIEILLLLQPRVWGALRAVERGARARARAGNVSGSGVSF
jgi:hypothetical protein